MTDPVVNNYQSIASLPESIKDFFYNVNDGKEVELITASGLSDEQLGSFFDAVQSVFIKRLPATLLFTETKKIASEIPEDKLKSFLKDYIGFRLLPIDDFLDGQPSAAIRALGGDPAAYPATRISMRTMQPADVVAEFLHEHPVNVPAFLEHRLREILESRVRGVRKDAETVQRLTRAEKIGGAEMEPAEAEKLVEELVSKIANVNIAYEQPAPQTTDAGTRVSQPREVDVSQLREKDGSVPSTIKVSAEPAAQPLPPRPTPLAVSRQGHGVTPEDEKEAEAFRSKIEHEIASPALSSLDDDVKTAAEKMVDEHGANLPVDLKARFKTIVESRLKGIRDQAETADLLGREVSKGGIGFGPALVDDIVRVIEKQSAAIHGARDEAIKKEKETFVKTAVVNTFAKDELRKRGEQEEIDRMYGALTGNKKARQVAPAPRTPPTPSSPKRGDGTDVQPAVASSTRYPLPATPSATPSAPSPYMYTPPAVISPKMRDVRPVESLAPAARLTGPVEELRNLTLTDFRRLSTDPAEACRKLTDKLDLLEGHSYVQRTEGIKAWKESEVYKLYMQILTASFAGGKSIPAFIAEAMSANRPTLTEREVHAIMEMNRQLKA